MTEKEFSNLRAILLRIQRLRQELIRWKSENILDDIDPNFNISLSIKLEFQRKVLEDISSNLALAEKEFEDG